jgi:MFS family permease
MQPVMMALFSPLAGRISDRVQPRLLVSTGISVVLLSMASYLTAITYSWQAGIFIGLAVGGFGYAFFASPNTNSIISSVDSKDYGVASAFEPTMRTVGISFGMGILMLLFSLQMGTAQITPEYHAAFVDSLRAAFIVFIIACAAAIIFSAMRGKLMRKTGE